MHRAIESINGPMLIEGSERADLTQIAVLPHVSYSPLEMIDIKDSSSPGAVEWEKLEVGFQSGSQKPLATRISATKEAYAKSS